jgi:hypothetical protein
MPAIDDLTAISRLLDVPPPADGVTAAGRARLDELTHHESGRQRPRRTNHGGRAGRGRRIGVLAAAISGAAAVAAAGTLVYPRLAQPGAAQHVNTLQTLAPSLAPGSVKQAILTAIGGAGGDVMHLTVSTSGGSAAGRGEVQYWWWPARPASGQQVHLVFFGTSTRVEVTFTEPASPPSDGSLEPIPASGLFLVPAGKTWQRLSQYPVDGAFTGTTDDLLNENYMRSTYLPRDKVINDHATIDGRSAIEFSNPGNPTLSELLWVDGQNYLPLRMVKLDSGATNSPVTRKVYDYQFLPASPANLALLTLSIPSGYRKASG